MYLYITGPEYALVDADEKDKHGIEIMERILGFDLGKQEQDSYSSITYHRSNRGQDGNEILCHPLASTIACVLELQSYLPN